MNGPSFMIHSDDEDEIVTIDQDDLNRRPAFPAAAPRGIGADYGAELLINPVRVSKEVMSHASTSVASSHDESSDYSTDDTDSDRQGYAERGARADPMAARFASERTRQEEEIALKKDLLHKIDRLESRGYKLPKKFTVHDDIDEIQLEYDRARRERDLDISVRFQSRMLITAVTGIEVLNNSYDPFGVYLRGWSNQVSSEIDDYHDIFIDLHDKYQSSNRKMAPELRLALSLGGSGFLYHLGNKVIKQSATPEVEDVLKSDPALMRQFQQAAAKRMGMAASAAAQMSQSRQAPQAPAPQPQQQGGLGGIFGNLLTSMMGGGPAMPAPPQIQVRNQVAPMPGAKSAGASEIDDIINEVTQTVKSTAPAGAPAPSRFETLSEDDDIISLVEDVVSNASASSARRGAGTGRGRGRGRGGIAPPQRVLNL